MDLSRRSFLKGSGAALAATVIPWHPAPPPEASDGGIQNAVNLRISEMDRRYCFRMFVDCNVEDRHGKVERWGATDLIEKNDLHLADTYQKILIERLKYIARRERWRRIWASPGVGEVVYL